MSGQRARPRSVLLALGAVISVVVLAGGCTAGQAASGAGPTATAPSATAGPTIARHLSPVELPCARAAKPRLGSGGFGFAGGDRYIDGLATMFFDQKAITLAGRYPAPTFTVGGRSYSVVKSVLYVTSPAAKKTTVTLLSPPTAWLDYTDGPILGLDSVAGATRKLIVDSCPGRKPDYHRGGLFVLGPTCLKFRVSGAHTVTREVGIGRKCPSGSR